MAKLYQDYESLRLAVNEALGNLSGTSSGSGDDNPDAVGTWSDLVSAFTSVGGSIG